MTFTTRKDVAFGHESGTPARSTWCRPPWPWRSRNAILNSFKPVLPNRQHNPTPAASLRLRLFTYLWNFLCCRKQNSLLRNDLATIDILSNWKVKWNTVCNVAHSAGLKWQCLLKRAQSSFFRCCGASVVKCRHTEHCRRLKHKSPDGVWREINNLGSVAEVKKKILSRCDADEKQGCQVDRVSPRQSTLLPVAAGERGEPRYRIQRTISADK
jgi:hypothetical protein